MVRTKDSSVLDGLFFLCDNAPCTSYGRTIPQSQKPNARHTGLLVGVVVLAVVVAFVNYKVLQRRRRAHPICNDSVHDDTSMVQITDLQNQELHQDFSNQS